VLVDADLRQGYLHQYFGLTQESGFGLSDAISGSCALEQSVHRGVLESVDFIGTGALPPNPSELLCHDNAARLLKFLSDSYDFVLIAAPPVLAVSDALVLGVRAGAVYLIVRTGRTALGEVKKSMERFTAAGIQTKGVIFNCLNLRKVLTWR